jgi:hypothetical protein
MDNKKDEKTAAAVPQPTSSTAQAVKPEDVPDNELEAVAGGHGHDRWYHHDHDGRRGYYRNGSFIQLNI